MKQPDRFERAVLAVQRHDDWCIPVVSADEAMKLLRKEHAWMRRLIKKAAASVENGIEPGAERNGYLMACAELMRELDQRRK